MINIDQFQPKPLSSDRKPSSACFKTWPKKSLFVFAAWIDFGSVLRQATTLRGASALTEIEHRELLRSQNTRGFLQKQEINP